MRPTGVHAGPIKSLGLESGDAQGVLSKFIAMQGLYTNKNDKAC